MLTSLLDHFALSSRFVPFGSSNKQAYVMSNVFIQQIPIIILRGVNGTKNKEFLEVHINSSP
jgi:hypothetical protein